MGWTAYYQLVRARVLDEAELAKVAALVRASQAEAWDGEPFGLEVTSVAAPTGVIARGWNKLAMDAESLDGDRLLAALDSLQALAPDGIVNAVDDFETLGWSGTNFELGAGTRRPLVADEGGVWESVLVQVPPPLARVEAATGGESIEPSVRILAALRALTSREVEPAPFVAMLAAAPPELVARVGLEHYQELQHGYHARGAIGHALDAASDPGPLVPAFLDAWETPVGTYYYGDFPFHGASGGRLAAVAAVRDRLIADLTDLEEGRATSELEQRRAEQAAVLLGQSRDPVALRRLAATVMRWRTEPPPFAVEQRGVLPALASLAAAEDPQWVPTTLLATHGATGAYQSTRKAIRHSLVARPELAGPLVRALLESGTGISGALEAVRHAGAAAAALADVVTPYLEYPSCDVRNEARAALAAIAGLEVQYARGEDLGDPEVRVLHRDRDVRAASLRTVHDENDRSWFVALVHGERVDAVLRAPIADNFLPFSWHSWGDIVPESVASMSYEQKLAWAAGAGAETLGPQRVWLAVADAAALPSARLQAAFHPPTIELAASVRAQLAALEAAAFAAT